MIAVSLEENRAEAFLGEVAKEIRAFFIVESGNARVAGNGVDHITLCRLMAGRQQICNYHIHVIFGKFAQACDALFEAWNVA